MCVSLHVREKGREKQVKQGRTRGKKLELLRRALREGLTWKVLLEQRADVFHSLYLRFKIQVFF